MCVLSKCGDSHILYLNQDHLNMLKLVTLKKLKEDFPDLNIRMELPGGLDVNRVTTPVLLNAPSSPESVSASSPSSPGPPGKTKTKTGGILGLFKSSSPDPPQPQNNLKGQTILSYNLSLFDIYIIAASPSSKVKTAEAELDPITNAFPPPKIQRQHTLIEPDPKSFQAILSKEAHTEKNVNNEVSKETLKVPVTDIFPEKLTEQNYSRRKKPGATTADTTGVGQNYFDL